MDLVAFSIARQLHGEGGSVGCVGFKNVCSSSEFLVLYKARSFFGASSVPLTSCSLLSMENICTSLF